MEEIDALVAALDELGSRFLQARRPGLSPSELREQVAAHWPPWWIDYIDDDIEAWWGWHNGVDPQALVDRGELWQACGVITPDRTVLRGVHEMLVVGLEVVGIDFMRNRDLGIVFPIAEIDGVAGELFLYKTSADSEWEVREHSFEAGLYSLEIADPQAPSPTFKQWLTALTEGITSRRLVLGDRGEVTLPGSRTFERRDNLYPWR